MYICECIHINLFRLVCIILDCSLSLSATAPYIFTGQAVSLKMTPLAKVYCPDSYFAMRWYTGTKQT